MKIFRKQPSLAGEQDASAASDSIAALSSALTEGAAQQEIAARRLAGLSDTIARLDASRREAKRLDAEVTRLTATLSEVERKFSAKSAWAAEQSAKYLNVKSERDELRQELEAAKAARAQLADKHTALSQDHATLELELSSTRAQRDAAAQKAELAEMAKAKLAETDAKRASAMKAQAHRITELSSATEDLTARLADKTGAHDQSLTSLRELRTEHAQTKEKLIEGLNALQTAEYQLTQKDAAHQDAMSRRADEVTALRRQVEQLSAELRIKDGMGEHYGRDLGELRTALQAERERVGATEARLRDASDTETRQASALAQAKIDYDGLAEKFSDALRDIEALRKVNQMQRKTLERYAELGAAPQGRGTGAVDPARPVRIVQQRSA